MVVKKKSLQKGKDKAFKSQISHGIMVIIDIAGLQLILEKCPLQNIHCFVSCVRPLLAHSVAVLEKVFIWEFLLIQITWNETTDITDNTSTNLWIAIITFANYYTQ